MNSRSMLPSPIGLIGESHVGDASAESRRSEIRESESRWKHRGSWNFGEKRRWPINSLVLLEVPVCLDIFCENRRQRLERFQVRWPESNQFLDWYLRSQSIVLNTIEGRYVGDRSSSPRFRQSRIRVHHRLLLEAVVVVCDRGMDWDVRLRVEKREKQDVPSEESRGV